LQLATWLRQQGAAWPLCLWHTNDADQLLCWKLETFKWAVTAGAYPYAWREQWTSSAGTAIAAAATAAAAAGGVDEAAAAAAAAAAAEPAVDSSSNSSNSESRMCAALNAAGYEDVVAWVHSLEAPPCNCVQSSPAAAAAVAVVAAAQPTPPAAAAAAAAAVAAPPAVSSAELLDDFQPCLHHCSKQQAV
jgi:hypothetical protein